MPTCRTCGARIEWALDAQGRRMPLDAQPVETGNVAVHRDDTGGLCARVITAAAPLRDGEKAAVAHFATCPGKRAPR